MLRVERSVDDDGSCRLSKGRESRIAADVTEVMSRNVAKLGSI